MSDQPHTDSHHHHGAPRVRFCSGCAAPLQRRSVEGKVLPVCPRCGQVVYADPKVAAGTIVEAAGRILLLRRAISPARGLWTFPGGYVDRGEPVPEAAAREAREEAGVTVAVGKLLGVYSARGVAVVLIVYRARLASGTPRPARRRWSCAGWNRRRFRGRSWRFRARPRRSRTGAGRRRSRWRSRTGAESAR